MTVSEATIQNLALAVNRLADLMEQQNRQRSSSIQKWREANPELAERCKQGATKFGEALSELLTDILDSVSEDGGLGSFLLGEFIDKFGPRLMHLNNMVQILGALGG